MGVGRGRFKGTVGFPGVLFGYNGNRMLTDDQVLGLSGFGFGLKYFPPEIGILGAQLK
tara:strand:+ start:1022 stop:1195 length:174 start_codon:yes stop_codon:yes gene_type:complete